MHTAVIKSVYSFSVNFRATKHHVAR